MAELHDYQTWFEQGLADYELEKPAEALSCFQKAIEVKPDFIPAWIYLGMSLERLQRYEEALAYYEKAIRWNREATDLWYNKGATLAKLHRYEEALGCFERVLELEPNNAIAKTTRCLTLATLESRQPAQKLSKKS